METERLAELIDHKQVLLAQLRQLAGRQAELIEQADMTALLGLLAAKQQVLSQVALVDRQLDPFREQEPEQRVWRSPGARQRAREAAACCESLLDEIMRVERQCELRLLERRDRTATRLQGVHSATQARQAYTQPNTPRRGQIDLSSET